jgi:hypothetical protein
LDKFYSILEFTFDHVEGLRRMFCCGLGLGLGNIECVVAQGAEVGDVLRLQNNVNEPRMMSPTMSAGMDWLPVRSIRCSTS